MRLLMAISFLCWFVGLCVMGAIRAIGEAISDGLLWLERVFRELK